MEKEYFGIKDFQEMYGVSYGKASELLNAIKLKLTIGQGKELRLNMRGRIHKLDYYEWRDSAKGAI